MNPKILLISCLLFSLHGYPVYSQEKPKVEEKVVRIGGVASNPNAVTIFKNLKTYLNRKGFRSDYVLYSNYNSLVEALERDEIEIAWTSPIPHATYHLRAGGSQTLAMRDVDQGLRVTLVVRAGSGIDSPKDLAGKRLILGSTGNAEGALLPVHFLQKEGVEIDQIEVVSLDKEKDSAGRRANSSRHVLTALGAGRGDAAIVLEQAWNSARDFRKEHPDIKQIWKSREFCHCTFTASQDFDVKLGSEFTRLITNMDPKDPLVAELNRLENAKKWLPANTKGFEDLYDALDNKAKLLKKAPRK